MSETNHRREKYRAFLKEKVSRIEVDKAQAQIRAGIRYDPEKWEAFLDFIEQDGYGLVTPHYDKELAPFECLPVEKREEFITRFGDDWNHERISIAPSLFLDACREVVGGKEAHDALMAQYDLDIKRGQQEAFNTFDMFSQGRNLGKLPRPDYVIAVLAAVLEKGEGFLRWLGVQPNQFVEVTSESPALPAPDAA